jgi:hypothetical protein
MGKLANREFYDSIAATRVTGSYLHSFRRIIVLAVRILPCKRIHSGRYRWKLLVPAETGIVSFPQSGEKEILDFFEKTISLIRIKIFQIFLNV